MDQKLTGSNILSYRGVNAYSPPEFVLHPRPPTTSDWRNFTIGTIWLDTNNSPPDNEDIYMLVSVAMSGTPPIHIATWVTFGGGGTGPQTITGDAGGPVSPDGALNINLFSSALALEFNGFPGVNTISLDTVSGNNLLETLSDDSDVIVTADAAANIKLEGTPGHITVTSDPGNNKLVFDYTGTNTDSFTTDAGVAVPALGNLNVSGSLMINTIGVGDTVTITSSAADTYTTDDTNAASPIANNINIVGVNGITTTSTGDTITINGSGAAAQLTFKEDSGSATAVADNINVIGATGIVTSGAGDTVTIAARGANYCSFLVYLNTPKIPNVTGDFSMFLVPFDIADFNIGSNYDLVNHWFIAPANGIYHFIAVCQLEGCGPIGTPVSIGATLYINGIGKWMQSNCWIAADHDAGLGGENQTTQTWIIKLNSGDKVQYGMQALFFSGPSKTIGIGGGLVYNIDPRTTFSGTLLA